MIIVYSYPPNYNEIRKYLRPSKGVVYTHGTIIYNPDKGKVDKALERHEGIHSQQQSLYGTEKIWMGILPPRFRIKRWWDRYLKDYAFRLSQEIPAYQIQYQVLKEEIKDKNKLNKELFRLARDLSSPMYGSIISMNDAMKAIQREELYCFQT